MLKICAFRGRSEERGQLVIPLFDPASDATLEKVAAPTLLPEVVRYIEGLRPRNDSQYHLVNAMGALEWWGSNINGDAFPLASLIHAPDAWTGNPLLDKIRAKDWPYGYPTFYFAHPYAHHRNKDASRAFGEVELALWNPDMKRVELVTRVDRDLCTRFGGVGVWDKLKAGEFPDVSMGCKVPFDTCSICLDWKLYREAQATFDPKKHRYEGEAVLLFHRALKEKNGLGIRGLSITRKDYCDHARNHMGEIFQDGRKVFVFNDYPRFFDISFVFIGADKTAKVMLKIADGGRAYWFLPGAELAEKLGYSAGLERAEEAVEKLATLGKDAKNKASEITKDVVPSQFVAKAVPVLSRAEEDLPRDLLDAMGTLPTEQALSTSAGLGIILRPHEFQRVMLLRLGLRSQADELDAQGGVFPACDTRDSMLMGSEFFHPALAALLLPWLAARSMLGPFIEKRIVVVHAGPPKSPGRASSLSSDLLRKMSAAYNGYRDGVMNLVAEAPVLARSTTSAELHKLAAFPVEQIFTPLSVGYLEGAFLDERGPDNNRARAGVERGSPSKNT